MADAASTAAQGARCEESEILHECVLKAAERVVALALSFQSDVALAKSEDAELSLTAMRLAVIKCSAANSLWNRHRTEHRC
jgi:hypothetical protein